MRSSECSLQKLDLKDIDHKYIVSISPRPAASIPRRSFCIRRSLPYFHVRHPKVSVILEVEFRRDRIVAVVTPQHPLAKARALPVRALAFLEDFD